MWMGRIPNDSIGAIRDGSLFRGRYEAIVVDGETKFKDRIAKIAASIQL